MNKMNQRSKVISIVLLAVWCFSLFTSISLAEISPDELQKMESAVPAKATVVPKQPRKLLIFNLCNGYKHSSIPYGAKALEIMGNKTGAYETVISENMALFKSENLKQFDAVCFNNSTRLEFKDPALRESLMDFVKGGKGVIGIHAAADNFYNWPEGAEMMGALFDGHPWHELVGVKLDDPEHPLCAVFKGKGFEIKDEIYQFKTPYSREKLRVLLSIDISKTNMNKDKIKRTDNDFAVSWVRSWDKGRVFYCSLGHRHEIFWNPVVLRYYLDGIQFALGDLPADTTPSAVNLQILKKLLADIAAYDYGQSREKLTEITDFVRNAYNYPAILKEAEKLLLAFLRSDATLAGKQFICRKLSVIGTEKAVLTLAAMLTDPATSDMARYALERIPGTAVNDALRKTLHKTTGKIKVGIINSLGQRRDGKSVAVLRGLIRDSDPAIAAAAVSALGQIADPQATKALAKARKKATGKLRHLVSDAYLKCADQLVAQGEQSRALKIYKQLYASGEPSSIRFAALAGMVTASGDKAVEIIVDVLRGNELEMQAVAISLVRDVSDSRITKAVAAELPNLPVTGQVQLLSALADRGDTAALPAVINATKSTEPDIRIAALGALPALGDDSTVNLLAQAAATTKAAEQQAARESLYRLRGTKVDQTILASIPQANPNVKIELIRSTGQRNIYTAVETLMKTAQDADSNVRLESIKVLRDIAAPEHISALVNLLVNAQSDTELKEAEKTVVSVSRKPTGENAGTAAVLAVLPSVKDIKVRCSLLQVLGKIGGGKALSVLQKALEDKNTEVKSVAIRALSDWPSPEPIVDLLKTAQSSDNEVHKVLALRGYVHLIGLNSKRPVEETIEMYQKAMSLAASVSDKKMVLSGLANVKSFAALYMASNYLEDETLQQEAGAAMVKIADTTRTTHPQQTKILLRMVLQTSKNDALREQVQKVIEQIK